MRTKDIINRVDTIWTKASKLYLDTKDGETNEAVTELIHALCYHCASIKQILDELPSND